MNHFLVVEMIGDINSWTCLFYNMVCRERALDIFVTVMHLGT